MTSATREFFLEISELVMKTYKKMLSRPVKMRHERIQIICAVKELKTCTTKIHCSIFDKS